jgi:hypothetical protein
MARTTTINAIALEVNQVPNKENKVYPKLVLFEPDQRFPSVISVSLKPEQIADAQALVGKRSNVTCEFSEYQGRVNYYFVSAAK